MLEINREDFKGTSDKTLEWSKIATFEITLIDRDSNQKVDLTSEAGQALIDSIQLKPNTPQTNKKK